MATFKCLNSCCCGVLWLQRGAFWCQPVSPAFPSHCHGSLGALGEEQTCPRPAPSSCSCWPWRQGNSGGGCLPGVMLSASTSFAPKCKLAESNARVSFCNVYFSSEWGTSFLYHNNVGKVDCEYLVTAVPYISFVSFYLIFVRFFFFFGSQFCAVETTTALDNPHTSVKEKGLGWSVETVEVLVCTQKTKPVMLEDTVFKSWRSNKAKVVMVKFVSIYKYKWLAG